MANNPVDQTPPPNNPGPDYSFLKNTLSATKFQKNNPNAYKTISALIDGVKKFQDFATSSFTDIGGQQTSLANSLNQQLNAIIQSLGSSNDAISSLTTSILTLFSLVGDLAFQAVYTAEFDTSGAPQSYNLSTDYDLGFVIVKDVAGNAAVNNITIVGVVDGVTDPQITTNYGIYRLYKSADNNFYTW